MPSIMRIGVGVSLRMPLGLFIGWRLVRLSGMLFWMAVGGGEYRCRHEGIARNDFLFLLSSSGFVEFIRFCWYFLMLIDAYWCLLMPFDAFDAFWCFLMLCKDGVIVNSFVLWRKTISLIYKNMTLGPLQMSSRINTVKNSSKQSMRKTRKISTQIYPHDPLKNPTKNKSINSKVTRYLD